MALIVEDGTGIVGAESYASVAHIDAYWAARSHMALSVTWAAATVAKREGAAREGTGYADAIYGAYYRGQRAGQLQGRLFPRINALDAAGFPMPGLPSELAAAVCELAARALSAILAADADHGGAVAGSTVKVGPVSVATTFNSGALARQRYGAVDEMLNPILDGTQPWATARWSWK